MVNKNIDLENRLIILSSDSATSIKMADDLHDGFSLDHTMGGRAIRLNSRRIPFGNGEQTFEIIDPSGIYSIENIKYMIRNGNTFFVSKLENPLLQRPFKYLIDHMIMNLGERYAEIKRSIDKDDENAKKEFKNRFTSYISSYIPTLLNDVIRKNAFEERLNSISNDIANIMRRYEEEMLEVFNTKDIIINENTHKVLLPLKEHLTGYFAYREIVKETSKLVFLDELGCISKEIHKSFLNDPSYKGEFNWILPFIDGRSDNNKKNPNEIIRVDDLPDMAEFYNVKSVQMIRAHSRAILDSFENRKIEAINFTQTNEYISLLKQDYDSFDNFYVLSPDEGGLADAMVFAREMHRRTNGKFKGRVIVFKKSRSRAEHIEGMEFLASYMYDSSKEKKGGDVVEDGKMQPYDKVFKKTFKDKTSDDYIGNLFNLEFNQEQEMLLTEKVRGHYAVLRDDIIGTASTVDKGARRSSRVYGSKVYGFVEHPSYTKNATDILTKLHNDLILETIYVSSSIVHPYPETRVWEKKRSMSDRFIKKTKERFMGWLEQKSPEIYHRLISN